MSTQGFDSQTFAESSTVYSLSVGRCSPEINIGDDGMDGLLLIPETRPLSSLIVHPP